MSGVVPVKRYGGKLILRIEDTNPGNIDPDAYTMIPEDLKWLGVDKYKLSLGNVQWTTDKIKDFSTVYIKKLKGVKTIASIIFLSF